MPVKREVHVHYACDGIACPAHGSNGKLPSDWRNVVISFPSSKDSPEVIVELKGTLCPKCRDKVYALFSKFAFPKGNEKKEVKNVNSSTDPASSGNTASSSNSSNPS